LDDLKGDWLTLIMIANQAKNAGLSRKLIQINALLSDDSEQDVAKLQKHAR
jgi:hypothetical protein